MVGLLVWLDDVRPSIATAARADCFRGYKDILFSARCCDGACGTRPAEPGKPWKVARVANEAHHVRGRIGSALASASGSDLCWIRHWMLRRPGPISVARWRELCRWGESRSFLAFIFSGFH